MDILLSMVMQVCIELLEGIQCFSPWRLKPSQKYVVLGVLRVPKKHKFIQKQKLANNKSIIYLIFITISGVSENIQSSENAYDIEESMPDLFVTCSNMVPDV